MYSKLVSFIVAVALVAFVTPASGVQARGLCVPSYPLILDHLIPGLSFYSFYLPVGSSLIHLIGTSVNQSLLIVRALNALNGECTTLTTYNFTSIQTRMADFGLSSM